MSKVDVVVPCYNYGRFLEECVRSVLDQSIQDVRVLIIDDASSDDSLRVAESLASSDSRISVISHPRNLGHIATYNEGLIGWAKADYSLLLSADDVLTPGALARAVEYLDAHRSVGLLYGHAAVWDDAKPRPAIRTRQLPTQFWKGYDWLRIVCSRGHCVTSTPTAIVRTAVQQRIGGYRSDLPHTADVEMWMRFAVHSDIAYIRGTDQAYYRVHGASMSVERVFIVDLMQRKAAYDAIFSAYGDNIRDGVWLHKQANLRLAKEALWRACAAYHRGRLHSTPVAELVRFAQSTYPEYQRLPEYWGLAWRKFVGPALCPYFQPLMISAVHRRARNWLWWRTWKWRGV